MKTATRAAAAALAGLLSLGTLAACGEDPVGDAKDQLSSLEMPSLPDISVDPGADLTAAKDTLNDAISTVADFQIVELTVDKAGEVLTIATDAASLSDSDLAILKQVADTVQEGAKNIAVQVTDAAGEVVKTYS
ncbi:hypothetical protein [Salininema proteolyticum]|uniref:BON domain-containing protein n=1 Tax=Salininema proteolyticum TaxID=1607685 RepID=A0ABV8TU07_9ACTN